MTNHFKSETCSPTEFDQLLTEYYSADDDGALGSTSLSGDFDLQSFANTLAPTEDLLSGANDAPIIKLINGVSAKLSKRGHQIYILNLMKKILLSGIELMEFYNKS